MGEAMLAGLAAGLVAVRHAGGYRFKVPERVLGQFTDYCAREGYGDGSIIREAVDGFLYGRHLRASTVRRNELVLRQLGEYARAHGWTAYIPPAVTTVRVRHAPPYVLTDDEIRRLFTVIDSQPMSSYSNKALVDPVLFRVLYGTGLFSVGANRTTGACSRFFQVSWPAGWAWIPRGCGETAWCWFPGLACC